MGTHTTITAEQIARVSERTGAPISDVRRALLGLTPLGGGREKILAALVGEGADPKFLLELSGAPGGRKAWVAGDGEILPTRQGLRARNARERDGGSR